MKRQEVIAQEEQYQLRTYRKKAVAPVRGEGCYLWEEDGTRYIDLYGGHCVVLLGHSHAGVREALHRQLDHITFYSNAVYSETRARAAKALADFAPGGLGNVFFCSTGTEANETALKIARKATGKPVVVAMEGGFHGRTLGSLSVTHGKYRQPYADIAAPTEFVPFANAGAVRDLLRTRDDVAAVILEPIQSMAGVATAPPAYFRSLRDTCSEFGVQLIFDEIQTGVGRTGTFSISERYGITPDLITLAKSLGNGVPVGAVLVNDALAATVQYGDQGTTFGGGMLAMAAVEATLTALRKENVMAKATAFESAVRHRIGPIVRQIRGAGCLLGLDLGMPAAGVIAHLHEQKIIVGGSNHANVMRLMPPALTPLSVVEIFAVALEKALAEAPNPA
ncbi:MAG: aspartate aminotransferase family protein [Rhodothermales bacterium]|nr:aspartate aminotransferase family protein [Rhodothermales bacterium]MBO6779376.1 aspartate aminotransferase family protein [Rhodothermales bacterium]